MSGNFELYLTFDSTLDSVPDYNDRRNIKSNPKAEKRANNKQINKFFMDNCPDFFEAMAINRCKNYMHLLRTMILSNTESMA